MTRLSSQLYQIVKASEKHMTAEEIFMVCKARNVKISIASVYRILSRLTEEGLVKKVAIAGEPDRFDKTVLAHDHMICEKCKAVSDIDAGNLKQILEERAGMHITSYELCIHYICPKCQKEEKQHG